MKLLGGTNYCVLGADGEFHLFPDQKLAERLCLRRLRGNLRAKENCSHRTQTFNGYVWRCKECGEKL